MNGRGSGGGSDDAASGGADAGGLRSTAAGEDERSGPPTRDRLDALGVRLDQLDAVVRDVERRLRMIEASLPTPIPAVPAATPTREPVPVTPSAPAIVVAERVTPRWEPAPSVPSTAERAPNPLERLPERPHLPHRPTMRSWSFADLERAVSGRGLAWAGGLALLLGALFFLSLAFSRGWIGPSTRVVLGLIAGVALTGLGGWPIGRRDPLLGRVLVAVGVGIWNLSLMAATRLYGLVPVDVGLLGALVGALAAATIAVRTNAQVIAVFGIVSALVAPPLLGAGPTGSTIAFLAAALVGTTAVALFRTWDWLPPIAFALTAPQAADWFTGQAPVGSGLVALAGFWLLHASAAGGEEFRERRSTFRSAAATLLLANAAFLVWAGFVLLDGDRERWRGLFLVAVALGHGALGGYFLRRQGDDHPFGILAVGTGIAALTMAVPVQLGGPPVPIAWAAEATALAWVYARRRHAYSAAVAAILGALAIAHLFIFEYPLWQLIAGREHPRPFLNASGGTLAFLLAALVVAGSFLRMPSVRIALAAVGIGLVVVALPYELSGIALLAGWSALAVLALAAQRWGPMLAGSPATDGRGFGTRWLGRRLDISVAAGRALHGLDFPAAAAAGLAVAHALAFDLPLAEFEVLATRPGIPFTDRHAVAGGVLVAAALAAAVVAPRRAVRHISLAAAFAAAGYLVPFELGATASVVAWAVLALGPLMLARRLGDGRIVYAAVAVALLGGAVIEVIGTVAPPERLVVDGRSAVDHPLFLSDATVALAVLVVVLAIGNRLYQPSRPALWLGVAAGAFAVYLLSVGVVDECQRRVGGEVASESLARQAQVALSVLWAVVGGGAVAAGLVRFGPTARLFGLALLALATGKVFIYDLASLDASYRVLSLVGLGVVLLASSYAYRHIRMAGGRGSVAGALSEGAERGTSMAAEARPLGHESPTE